MRLLMLLILPLVIASTCSPLFIKYGIKGEVPHDKYLYDVYDADRRTRITFKITHSQFPGKKHEIAFMMTIENLTGEPLRLSDTLIRINLPGYTFANPGEPLRQLAPHDSVITYNVYRGVSGKTFEELYREMSAATIPFEITGMEIAGKKLNYRPYSLEVIGKEGSE